MFKCAFLAALCGLACLPAVSAFATDLSVKLTVTEQAGVERIDEPVTFGVPLSAGAVKDVQTLALLDGQGKVIPASFGVAQKWLQDGSVQWVHVNCLLSVPAKRSKMLTLTNKIPAGAVVGDAKDAKLKVDLDAQAAKATIVTGPVKLVLSAHLAGVIESAGFDPTGAFGTSAQVLGGAEGSGVQAGGKTFTEIDPTSASAEVLEQSSMKAVVLVKGVFKGANEIGSAGAGPGATPKLDDSRMSGPGFCYEARVTAFSGSPRVTIDYTLINKIGERQEHKIDLEGLSLVWTAASGAGWEKVSVGSMDKPLVDRIADNMAPLAAAYQDSADQGQVELVGRKTDVTGKTGQSLTNGWVGLSGADRGLAVGVRDFWQTYPKELEVLPGGPALRFRVGLYPRRAGKSQELYIGQARTHRITLLFHDGKMAAEKVQDVFVAANKPLLPVASPAWYCQQTKAYGAIASADADYGPYAATARHYDQNLDKCMDLILKQLHDGRTHAGITQDSYGWMNWGDTFFRKKIGGPDFADRVKNLSWNGNYYDYGFAMICQFLRTGQWRYLETGLRAGAYTADVFVVHYFPDPTRIGVCHYCPPTYHAAYDDGKPYVSEECNHAKVASIVARWHLLADHWARQVAGEVFDNALTMKNVDMNGWRQPRGNGHRLRILWLAYHLTGEKKYLDKAAQLIAVGDKFVKDNNGLSVGPPQYFMIGTALEGLVHQYADQPPEVRKTILGMVQLLAEKAVKEHELKGYTPSMSMAYGFLWQQTGNADYLKTLVRILDETKPNDQAKLFGQFYRGTPWALGYLHEATAKGRR